MYGTPFLLDCLETQDIVFINEHWLLPEQLSYLDSIHERFDGIAFSDSRIPIDIESRTCLRGFGGVGVLYRKELSIEIKHSQCSDKILVLEVRHETVHILLITVLLPSTNQSMEEYRNVLNDVQAVYDAYSSDFVVIVTGDFNGQISRQFGAKNPETANQRGKELEKFIKENMLISVNSQDSCAGPDCTYYSHDGSTCSLIDHVLVPECYSQVINKCSIVDDHPLNISDHHPVAFVMDLNVHRTDDSRKPLRPLCINWGKASEVELICYKNCVSSKLYDLEVECNTIEDINSAIIDLVCILHEAAFLNLPQKRFRNYLKPYWKYLNVKQLHDKMRMNRANWVAAGRPRGMQFKSFRRYKASKDEFRREIDLAKERYENEQYDLIERACEVDIGTFFNATKSVRRGNWRISEIKHGDKILHESYEICAAWKEHFEKLAYPTESEEFNDAFRMKIEDKFKTLCETTYTFMDKDETLPITENEEIKAIKRMKNGKAFGHDSITAEHMKYGGASVSKYLCRIYNGIVQLEEYPHAFKRLTVVPLFK
ncbi:hypothetical protein SNE40_012884 [Patella caerulea]|uniref:Endonuclease/exonuclease/phosphatase domain-containing protein n=1 Tax=Patella caerulea TaxID=87958 RepID=A0AAN8PSW5_PATCE